MSLHQTAYLARESVPHLDALQAAVDSLGFDCKIDASYAPFSSSGFLPCVLAGRDAGFEIYFESAAELLADFPHMAESVGNRDVAITFRWGGDLAECACVLIVSAALAKSFGAIIHYQDDNLLFSAEQLASDARTVIASL